MIVSIYIGTSKVDLFNDEDISVNSSVVLISDITKNQTDYTKTFTVPASDNNNQLFKHYYDADIDNSFDARIKVDGEIRMDGLPFRIGKFRLSKVSVKKNEPSAYTINFWGNLLTIKDKIGKDYLKDLDLTAFDHTHSNLNVKNGLTGSILGGGFVYNLMVKKQYYYDPTITDTTMTDTLANIGYGDGSGSNGVAFDDLRPSIAIIKIIEAIETDYDIEFSRDFFGRDEFTKIYTWLNPSKDTVIGGNNQQVDFDGGSSANINHATNIGSFTVSNTAASNDNNYWILPITVTPNVGFTSVPYTVRVIVDGEINSETEYSGGTHTPSITLNTGNAPSNPHTFAVTWEVVTSTSFEYTTSLVQYKLVSGTISSAVTTTSTNSVIISNFIMAKNMPKVKIMDFLKGLFNMFKLIVIPQDDGTIYVDTLKNYYANGKLVDVTKYIDFNSYDVDRGVILNEINFLYEEPTTILNKTFEENTSIAYGDEELILKDDAGELLDGTKLEFKLPFETVLFERLTETDGSYTNIQYGAIIDEELKPVNPKMVLFYNVLQPLNGDNVAYITAGGVKDLITTSINMPSHTLGFFQPNFSLLFGAEYSTWDSNLITKTLYKAYHEDYILSIFNIRKRNFKYTAILPLNILMNLELNAILKVGTQLCRIDSFKTNLISGKTTLNLINSFEDVVVGAFIVTVDDFLLTPRAQQVSSDVTNTEDLSITPRDVGDGLGWLTVTQVGSNVFYDVTENLGTKDRFAQVDLYSKQAGDKTITVYIQQEF